MKKIIFFIFVAIWLIQPCFAQNKKAVDVKTDANGVTYVQMEPKIIGPYTLKQTMIIQPDGTTTTRETVVINPGDCEEFAKMVKGKKYEKILAKAIEEGAKPNSKGLYVIDMGLKKKGTHLVEQTLYTVDYAGAQRFMLQTRMWKL